MQHSNYNMAYGEKPAPVFSIKYPTGGKAVVASGGEKEGSLLQLFDALGRLGLKIETVDENNPPRFTIAGFTFELTTDKKIIFRSENESVGVYAGVNVNVAASNKVSIRGNNRSEIVVGAGQAGEADGKIIINALRGLLDLYSGENVHIGANKDIGLTAGVNIGGVARDIFLGRKYLPGSGMEFEENFGLFTDILTQRIEVPNDYRSWSYELSPNTLVVFKERTEQLTLSLKPIVETRTQFVLPKTYHFLLEVGSVTPTVTWMRDVKWVSGVPPTVTANKTYEVIVQEGVARYYEADTSTKQELTYQLDVTSLSISTGNNRTLTTEPVTIVSQLSAKTYNNTNSVKVAYINGSQYLTITSGEANITSVTLTGNTDDNSRSAEADVFVSRDGTTWEYLHTTGVFENRLSAPTERTVEFQEPVQFIRFAKSSSPYISIGAIQVTYVGEVMTFTASVPEPMIEEEGEW